MKFLRKFETEAEYDAFKHSNSYVVPNVVLVNGAVDYNPIPPPLYVEALASLRVAPNAKCEYSKDNVTWISIERNTEIQANAGERVFFRASGLTVGTSSGICRFYIYDGNCKVGGNIMSMVYGAYYNGKTVINQNGMFMDMFREATKIVDASDLILPATTLTLNCYRWMFYGCSNLVRGPELPAKTLANSCYYGMFQNCSKLSYIKAMFTTTPSTTYTNNWVNGVSSTGTFVKNAAATWDVTGVNGIPSGWTVETADA